MDEREVMYILQKYRHDVMNHIQLIHGYLSMNRPERAKEMLDEWIELCDQERRLSSLRIPKFQLWAVRFDTFYSRLRLKLEIDVSSVDLSEYDDELHRFGNEAADAMLRSSAPEVLHEVTLYVKNDKENTIFELRAEGPFKMHENFGSDLETDLHTEYAVNEHEIYCKVMIPYKS